MILLNRNYGGYLAGTIVQLATSTEAALIAQGFATSSAGPVTGGAVNAGNLNQGRVGVGIGAASVVVTNSNITAESKVFAVVAQAAADGTALRVERIVCTAATASVPAFFTIYMTAAATALTTVDWVLMLPTGETTTN
jgi:hypothetical protein